MKSFKIKIEVSARHCHLSEKVFRKLFGRNAELSVLRELSQPGEFAAKEMVGLKTKKAEFKNIRIIGPLRPYTQIEVSATDARKLGLKPPTRMSGKLKDASSVTLIGPRGSARVKEALILANRHIHANPKQAKKLGLRNGQHVKVEIKGERSLVFDKVIVKLSENYELAMHIDTDEANACGLNMKNPFGKVIIK